MRFTLIIALLLLFNANIYSRSIAPEPKPLHIFFGADFTYGFDIFSHDKFSDDFELNTAYSFGINSKLLFIFKLDYFVSLDIDWVGYHNDLYKKESACNKTEYDVFNHRTSLIFSKTAIFIGTGYYFNNNTRIGIAPFFDIGLTSGNSILIFDDIEETPREEQEAWDFTYRIGANLAYFFQDLFLELSFYYEYYRPNKNFKSGMEGVRQDVLLPILDATNPHRFFLTIGVAFRFGEKSQYS